MQNKMNEETQPFFEGDGAASPTDSLSFFDFLPEALVVVVAVALFAFQFASSYSYLSRSFLPSSVYLALVASSTACHSSPARFIREVQG